MSFKSQPPSSRKSQPQPLRRTEPLRRSSPPPPVPPQDINDDIEVAAYVIKQLLYVMPWQKRAAALDEATRVENEERSTRDANGNLPAMTYTDGGDEFHNSVYVRRYHDIMQMKAHVVFKFVRAITNNNSPQEARDLLFGRYPLADYLHNVGMTNH
jgi:hypothetical protein